MSTLLGSSSSSRGLQSNRRILGSSSRRRLQSFGSSLDNSNAMSSFAPGLFTCRYGRQQQTQVESRGKGHDVVSRQPPSLSGMVWRPGSRGGRPEMQAGGDGAEVRLHHVRYCTDQ